MKEIAFLESNRDGKGGTANQQTRKTRDGKPIWRWNLMMKLLENWCDGLGKERWMQG